MPVKPAADRILPRGRGVESRTTHHESELIPGQAAGVTCVPLGGEGERRRNSLEELEAGAVTGAA
ncbi:hypothetical protein JZ751_000854 [Albula glossodonta]|uniref:Uncharacterized protein n=1 Tax=Albula glossodonta TaxID=121402 RepID=A0A8T2PXD7_9TELE|nr:hypothetical protein JZ751_000854 [Albula glossodonta]